MFDQIPFIIGPIRASSKRAIKLRFFATFVFYVLRKGRSMFVGRIAVFTNEWPWF